MVVKHRIYDGTLYMVLSGELDEHSATYVRSEMDFILSNNKYKQIIKSIN